MVAGWEAQLRLQEHTITNTNNSRRRCLEYAVEDRVWDRVCLRGSHWRPTYKVRNVMEWKSYIAEI